MISLKVFVKDDCPRCPEAKKIVEKLKKENVKIIEYNIDTVDGMAEAAFYNVMSTPTMIIVDSEDQLIAEWRDNVPTVDVIIKSIDFYLRNEWRL